MQKNAEYECTELDAYQEEPTAELAGYFQKFGQDCIPGSVLQFGHPWVKKDNRGTPYTHLIACCHKTAKVEE